MSGKLDLDEFAGFNQQLAGMLKAGLPLEGSLEQLSASMSKGRLREECEALRRDLQAGRNLADALAERKLPDIYKRMVSAGAAGGGLIQTLGMAGDYYSRLAASLARIRVMLVYPIVVLVLSVLCSAGMIWMLREGLRALLEDSLDAGFLTPTLSLFIPSFLAAGLAALFCLIILSPVRRWLRWKLPPFKEEALSQFASTAACLLRSGLDLREVVGLLAGMEGGSAAGKEALVWAKRMEQGLSQFEQIASEGRVFPPLFRWVVAQGGEDLASGFERSADLYRERALRRQEVLKQLIAPLTTAAAGCFVLAQFAPIVSYLRQLLRGIGM